MVRYFYAHTEIESITDDALQRLFDEIASLRNIPKSGMVIQFLYQAARPFPPLKAKRFSKLEIIPGSLLGERVGKLAHTEIFKLCIDLAAISQIGTIENYGSLTLFGLLNKVCFNEKKSRAWV